MSAKDFESVFVREHVDIMARINWNKVGFRDGWTKKTARTTLDICFWLWLNGYRFGTEVKMKNGLRADILVPELYGSQVIEVMDSETPEMLDVKRKKYSAGGIEMLGVPADTSEALKLIMSANGLKY